MARAVHSLFVPPIRSTLAPALNREGAPSWTRSIEEQTLQVLCCNFLGNTFYADAKGVLAETEKVFDEMLAKDPEFFAKALLHSRERAFMRTSSILGLVKLFSLNINPAHKSRYLGSPVAKEAAKLIFDRIIRTPNDLSDFASIVRARRNGEGGQSIKKAGARWLENRLNEYNVVKYGAEKSEGVYSLRDLMCAYHPKMSSATAKPLANYLLGRAGTEFPPMIAQYEALKRATTDVEKIQAITLGRLPHEVATAYAGNSKSVWDAIAPNMPIFALLRNLATLERHGVLENHRAHITKMFTSEEVITKSMIFPFRFLEAEKHVSAGWCKDLLRDALELSFVNVPELKGRTAVLLDVSPSMKAGYRSDDMMRHAAVFAVTLMKRAGGNGRLVAFDANAFAANISMRDSILTQAERVAALQSRGGTNQTAAIEALGTDAMDNIIMITDGEQNEFASSSPSAVGGRRAFVDALDEYKRKVNSQVKVFIMDVSPHRDAITPDGTKENTWYVYGFTDAALRMISIASAGFGDMVDVVRRQPLSPEVA